MIKKISLITVIFIFIAMTGKSQNGSITPEMMSKIKKSYDIDNPETKALTNALTNNDINKLALNHDFLGKTDHEFKYKVNVKGITDQKSSGRCWMFTGLNVLRPKVMEKYNLNKFEFSYNYLFFWDQFEKANLFLQAIIESKDKPMDDKTVEWLFKNPISDGGVWNSMTNLVEKYGVIPKNAMVETHNSENTRWMGRILRRKLREDGLKLREIVDKSSLENEKIKMLGEIYRILALNLGEPPTEFNWRYKDKEGNLSEYKAYTPTKFYNEILPENNFNDYVMLMNDPSREYYKLYEIEYDRNVMEGKNWIYINLPADEIKKYAVESIKNNEAMYASCDVGKQLNRDEGILSVENYDFESIYGIEFGMNKKERIISFESGSSHGMALIAVDVDKNEKPVKWQFENSWGSSSGHNGYLTFTDKWFDEYMFRVVVLKKFVDQKTLEVLKQKPILLPPYDPMYKLDK